MPAASNDDIQWLISLLLGSGLVELEVREGDLGVLVRRDDATVGSPSVVAPSAPTAADTHDLVPVTAPMAGVFYRSSAPDSPPFVEDGDEVQAGETLALIEAMKLYNDVEAPCAGRVTRILLEDATRVVADQELMYIKPLGD